MWTHMSLTGPWAGVTACGETLATAHARGETTAHVPYAWDDAAIRAGFTCPACLAAWFSEDEACPS